METFGIMFVYVSKKYGMFLMQFFLIQKKLRICEEKPNMIDLSLHLCWMLKIKNISILLILFSR